MISIFITALLMGMIGSIHCAGMCGPLALSLPVNGLPKMSRSYGILLYNFGRVITYSSFGLLIGMFGNALKLTGFQQWLSILGGSIIFFYLLHSKCGWFNTGKLFSPFFELIRKKLGELYFKKTLSSILFIGILNGFLPCGFVYLAFAGAIAAGDILGSTLFMAGFGLGTIPMMWSISFLGSYLNVSFSKNIKKIYPYTIMLIAFLLIVRGLGLGIPYLSPAVEIKSGTIHSCCHK
jgi:sulfite exporter TauE/SafE